MRGRAQLKASEFSTQRECSILDFNSSLDLWFFITCTIKKNRQIPSKRVHKPAETLEYNFQRPSQRRGLQCRQLYGIGKDGGSSEPLWSCTQIQNSLTWQTKRKGYHLEEKIGSKEVNMQKAQHFGGKSMPYALSVYVSLNFWMFRYGLGQQWR